MPGPHVEGSPREAASAHPDAWAGPNPAASSGGVVTSGASLGQGSAPTQPFPAWPAPTGPGVQSPTGFYGSPNPEPTPMWSSPPPAGADSSGNWPPPTLSPPRRRTGKTIAIAAGSAAVVVVVLGVIGAIAGTNKHKVNVLTSNRGSAVPVNSPTTPPGFTAFHSTADQFTIDIPNTWKAVDPTSPGAQAAMNEIEQSNPDLQSSFATNAIQLAEQGIVLMAVNTVMNPDGFASNINVEAKPDLTYSASDLSQLAASLPAEYAKLGGTITGTSYLTFDGHQALRLSATLSINTPLGTHVNVNETQYFVGANGFLYALTLSGSDPNLAAIASSFSTN